MKFFKQKKLKSTFIYILAFLTATFPVAADADVLGTHIQHSQSPLAQGTVLYTNTYNDSTVGNQTEHYISYTPSEDVLPILTNGWTAYGKRTLTDANKILTQQGYNTAGGMNGDFFSFQTGVPMSNTIIDGKVFTKDSSWLWGLGFRKDGTAFTAKFPITTTITAADGYCFTVECINKYRQPYALYLYTNDFADNTHSPDWGRDVVLGSISGDIRLGSSITAVVEGTSDNDGSVPIPEGKMILSVSAKAEEKFKEHLTHLKAGDTITITTNAAESPELWNSAQWAIGCTGGKLLTNGALDLEDEAAAPRSAVGIKPDGTVIFYTIDGRQKGYSYGVRKETLARRLLELGCTEAVNLDGGGSTSMGAVLAGTTDFKVVNSPSDGSLRSCANFLFLRKTAEATGIPYGLVLNNYGTKMLSGASVDVSVISAYDSSYGPANIPANIEYYIENDADTPEGTGYSTAISRDGHLTVRGNGDVYVGARSGDATGSTLISSITTPHELVLYNADKGYPINELVMEPGASVSLTAESYWYGINLVSDSSCYKWTIVNDGASVGTIEPNGVFHASSISGATGTLAVNAGLCVLEIPVLIREGGEASIDTGYPTIEGSVNNGILTALILNNEKIKAENITVTVDAQAVAFKYDENKRRLTCDIADDGLFHRIGIFVTAPGGASSMKFIDVGNVTQIKNQFSDTGGHWASGYISYLANCKVVEGSLEDENTILFNPQKNMTRTEFAIMLCNYLGVNPDDYKDVELPFTDKGDIPWWAENRIKAVYSLGIMKGQLEEYGVAFRPNAHINRMEFAISLCRLLPGGLAANPITAVDADDIPFWAEQSMRTIVTQKIMSGYPDGTLLPLQNVTRAEAVKMLFNVFGA